MEIKGEEKWWKECNVGLGSLSRDSGFNVAAWELERALTIWFVAWNMDHSE